MCLDGHFLLCCFYHLYSCGGFLHYGVYCHIVLVSILFFNLFDINDVVQEETVHHSVIEPSLWRAWGAVT